MRTFWLAILMLAGSVQVLSQPAPKWRKAGDGFYIHQYYLSGYKSLIGEYWQERNGEVFVAQCAGDVTQRDFFYESQARAYVVGCGAE